MRRGVLLLLIVTACHLPTEPRERCEGLGFGRSASLEGRVTSFEGQPIANAHITVGNHEAQTDAEGSFVFRDLTAGTYPVGGTLFGEIKITRGRNFVRVVTPSSALSGWAVGRVLDACDGRPIAGATLGTPDHFTVTDANGTYAIGACCNSVFGQMVSKDGYVSQPFNGSRIHGTYFEDYVLTRN